MEHQQDKEIQVCSHKVPGGHIWPHPRDLNFYIEIYREILQQFSSQELLTKWDNISHGASLGQGDSDLFK